MPEEKQEKKKPGIIKRILKWIGLGLLTILIIAGLLLQAPWKLITLLFIILLACSALPKPMRKWFWVTVGIIVITLIAWIFLPDNNKDWRPYTFDDELAALEAKYAKAIADKENAATIYNQLFQDYNEDDFEPNLSDPNIFYDVFLSEPWLSKDYPEMAEWLKTHESTITTLLQASKVEKCLFPITADPIRLGQSMDRLSSTRRWTYLLVCASNNDIAEGRINAGLEKYLCIIQLADHTSQQPALIDILVGIAVEELAINRLKKLLVTGDVTEEHLNVIENSLASINHNWNSDLLRFLEHDKLMHRNDYCKYFYEINPKGKIRLNRDPEAFMRGCFRDILNEDFAKTEKAYYERLANLTYWRKKYMKAGTILSWFYMPPTPQVAAKIIDVEFEEYGKMASDDFDWEKKSTVSFTTPLIPTPFGFRFRRWIVNSGSYYQIHNIYIRTIAERRGSQLLIALRRYKNKNGIWPQSLDEIKNITSAENLIDPINHNAFVYKLTEENFTLYSKGKNNIDESGEYLRDADDWPIWPLRGTKSREETTNDQ